MKFMLIFNLPAAPYDLIYAAAKGRDRTIREILAEGVDVNTIAEYKFIHDTALHFAAFHGKLKAVDALIAGGAEVDLNREHGSTPLWYACSEGHIAVAERLLDNGADINTQGFYCGRTPLHRAAEDGNTRLVRLLLERGANPAIRDFSGKTARESALAGEKKSAAALLRLHTPKKVLPPMALRAPLTVKRPLQLKSRK